MKDFEEFGKFLEFAEAHGWKLQEIIWSDYRSFTYQEEPDILPFVCKVSNRRVSVEYVEKFKKIIEEIWGNSGEPKPST